MWDFEKNARSGPHRRCSGTATRRTRTASCCIPSLSSSMRQACSPTTQSACAVRGRARARHLLNKAPALHPPAPAAPASNSRGSPVAAAAAGEGAPPAMLMRGMGCGGGCMHDITGGRDSRSTTSTAPPSLSAAAAAPLSPGAPGALTGRLRGGRRKCHVCPSGRCPSRSLCITSPMEMSASEQSVESTCVRHATAL